MLHLSGLHVQLKSEGSAQHVSMQHSKLVPGARASSGDRVWHSNLALPVLCCARAGCPPPSPVRCCPTAFPG